MTDIAAERRSLERPYLTVSTDDDYALREQLEITPRNSATDGNENDDKSWMMPMPPFLQSPLAQRAALEVELLENPIVLQSDLAKAAAVEVELLEKPLKLVSLLGKAMAAVVEGETSPSAKRFVQATQPKRQPPPVVPLAARALLYY